MIGSVIDIAAIRNRYDAVSPNLNERGLRPIRGQRGSKSPLHETGASRFCLGPLLSIRSVPARSAWGTLALPKLCIDCVALRLPVTWLQDIFLDATAMLGQLPQSLPQR